MIYFLPRFKKSLNHNYEYELNKIKEYNLIIINSGMEMYIK